MLPFLEGNVPFSQGLGILFLDLSLVAQEHVEALHFGQDRCAYSAFGAAQYNNS